MTKTERSCKDHPKVKRSPAKEKLHTYLVQYRPNMEFIFHPTRKWRFDYAWPERRLAVEFEGGVFIGGGHTRGLIYGQNCEKYNTAVIMGWRVLRFTAPMIRAGMHETMIGEALK